MVPLVVFAAGAVILALATVPFIRISYQNASTWKIG
jgi:hypothetical protein